MDEFSESVITKPVDGIGTASDQVLEKQIVDGTVNGTGVTVTWLSGLTKQLQTGHIGFYLFAMVIGIIIVLFTSLVK